MKNVKELRQKVDSPSREFVDKHESYGMVSIRHAGRSMEGEQLFGSSIKHNNFIVLQIHTAERHRDKYSDHYFPRKRLIEIKLSPAQFTGFLTQPNSAGVPCTISMTENNPNIESPPDHNVREELETDLSDKYKELKTLVYGMEKRIDSLLTGPVKKADKEEIKNIMTKLKNDIGSNLEFLQKVQTEKLEKVGVEIIAEAEAAVNSMIKSVGLEELQKQAKLLGQKNPKKITTGE